MRAIDKIRAAWAKANAEIGVVDCDMSVPPPFDEERVNRYLETLTDEQLEIISGSEQSSERDEVTYHQLMAEGGEEAEYAALALEQMWGVLP